MTEGLWYITPTAVRELLAIKGLPDAYDGPQYEQCEGELHEAARRVTAGDQQGRPLDSVATQYRGPRPLRLRLTVAPPRPGQPLPQLVRVQPDHEGRRGTYTDSAPERQTGHTGRDNRSRRRK